MSVLPLNWQDKENSPQLLAFLQQFGEKTYLSAEEINQFRDAINYLYNTFGGGSGITNDTGFTFVGTDLVFNNLFGWKFQGTDYVLDSDLSIPVPYTNTGKHRTDVIVARGDTLVRLPGTEYDLNVPAPAPTFNILEDLFITSFEVNESGYGSATGTISGDSYIKKIFYQPVNYNESGTDKVIPLDPLGRREFVLTNANLESIKGFNLSLITPDPNAEQPILGFDLRVRNMTGRDVVLKHNGNDTGVIVFLSKNGEDVVIPNGEFIDLRRELGNYYEGLSSWSEFGNSPKTILHDSDFPIHTGVTGVTVIKNVTIPANTIPENCFFRLVISIRFTKSTNYKYFYVTANSTNVNIRRIVNYIATGTNNASWDLMTVIRNCYIKDGVMHVTNTAHYRSDYATSDDEEIPFDVSIDNDINFWCNLANASEEFEIYGATVEVIF